jgi:hypothetical protein
MEMYNERLRHVLFHLLREAFNPVLRNNFGTSCMPQSALLGCEMLIVKACSARLDLDNLTEITIAMRTYVCPVLHQYLVQTQWKLRVNRF